MDSNLFVFFFWQSNGKVEKFFCLLYELEMLREFGMLCSLVFIPLLGCVAIVDVRAKKWAAEKILWLKLTLSTISLCVYRTARFAATYIPKSARLSQWLFGARDKGRCFRVASTVEFFLLRVANETMYPAPNAVDCCFTNQNEPLLRSGPPCADPGNRVH